MFREIQHLQQLRKSVSAQFGKQISTSTDCIHLADVLSKTFTVNISPQTLRRFFGLITSASSSSKFTLNLLSRFCGYLDYRDFIQSYSDTELELFFGNTENTNQNYWHKSALLCKQISVSPELLLTTHHRLMSFPMARKYFMEHHPMRDLLGSVYAQYFLTYLKFNHSNEAKIFAYGFLVTGAFLVQNSELMELFYHKVKNTELTKDVYVIPAGLKYGVQLLYADFTGNEYLFRKYLAEMKEVRLKFVEQSEKSVCSFEYTVLELLIFTNRTKEMKFLIENNTFQKTRDEEFVSYQRKKTHEEVWNILCAVAYEKMKDDENRDFYLNKIQLENLESGWQKYYSILYYFVQLKKAESSEKPKILSQLDFLIDQTYFSYYEKLLNDYLQNSEENAITFEKNPSVSHSSKKHSIRKNAQG